MCPYLELKGICWKEQREKSIIDASLIFMEIVKFAMRFWCCSLCLLLGLPSISSRSLESQFNSELNLLCRGLPSTLWCLTGAACTGAASTAGGCCCRSSSSKGSTKELKTSLRDFSQLYLFCWKTYSFLRSALKINSFFWMALWFVTASVSWSYLVCLSFNAQYPWTKENFLA